MTKDQQSNLTIKVHNLGIYQDGKYYRVYVAFETHTLHSEKLNFATAKHILGEMLLVN